MLRGLTVVSIAALLCCSVFAGTADNVCSTTLKGSVLVFPKVEVRFNAEGNLVQDTFIDLNNDNTSDVHIVMLFRTDDGACTIVYNDIDLTKNQPLYWSAATGEPAGVAPFSTLVSPYPDPEGTGEFVLRGYLLVIATDNSNAQINWNHLYGEATIVNYKFGTAWGYNAYAFRALLGTTGTPVGVAGDIKLNGVDYDWVFSTLLMDFVATGSHAFSGDGIEITHDTDVTLVIANFDMRQDHPVCPPITKAKYFIWNEEEFSFSAEYCISRCGFDESLFCSHGGAFLVGNLHTDKGRARIEGQKSIVCDGPICVSGDFPLLGVQKKVLHTELGYDIYVGGPLWGSGLQAGEIQYDVTPPPGKINKPVGVHGITPVPGK